MVNRKVKIKPCPMCGKPRPRPKPSDEVELDDIFDRHGIKSKIGQLPNGPDSTRLLRQELLEWKGRD